MKNITLAMVAVLAAVTMLSAGLAVASIQQASATVVMNGGSDGDKKTEIEQENNCGRNEDGADTTCTNTATVENDGGPGNSFDLVG
jgi:hypothetical protein